MILQNSIPQMLRQTGESRAKKQKRNNKKDSAVSFTNTAQLLTFQLLRAHHRPGPGPVVRSPSASFTKVALFAIRWIAYPGFVPPAPGL